MNTKIVLVRITAWLCYLAATVICGVWVIAFMANPEFQSRGIKWVITLAFAGLLLDLFADIGERVLRMEQRQSLNTTDD